MYPTLNPAEEQTPIAIEYAYFLEDGQQDPSKPNRYYFNFPQEWCTSNRGESIIGVRNIFMLARSRKIEFTLGVRKYRRDEYDKLKHDNPLFSYEQLWKYLEDDHKSEVFISINSWLNRENDFSEVWNDIQSAIEAKFVEFNIEADKINKDHNFNLDNQELKLSTKYSNLITEYQNLQKEIEDLTNKIFNEKDDTVKAELQKELDKKNDEDKINIATRYNVQKEMERIREEIKLNELKPTFHEEKTGLRRRDVQTDGFYDYENNMFYEIFYSPTNGEQVKDSKYKNYYVDLSISFRVRPPNNKSPYRRFDFDDVYNIGYEPFNNHPEDFMDLSKPVIDKDGNIIRYEGKWMRELRFKNVWDRHSCAVYSSIAEQSNKYYLGNSQIYFNPIKYFKLNSTDQRFWIDFYSGRHNNIPILIPNNESFKIEMIFLPYKKMLYI